LLTRPRLRWAIGAALSLFLVVLCDYYYFLFSVVAAVAIVGHLWRRKELRLGRRDATVFGVLAAVLTLPLPAALVWSNLRDRMQGGHPSVSSDVLSLLIDGGHWRFHWLTSWYYGAPGAGVAESTIYLTVTVVVLLAVAVRLRGRAGEHTGFWLWFAAVAALFSLGPHLVVHGTDTGVPMPFDLARTVIPVLNYNLEPPRIAVMTSLAVAVLASMVLSRLDLRGRRDQLLAAVVCAGVILELWPASPPVAPVGRPPYVAALKRLPPGAVIDDAAVTGGQVDKSLQLYDQVLDGQPVAFGYISRTPGSVARADFLLHVAIIGHRYGELCHSYHFSYITTPAATPLPGSLRVVYRDNEAIIYALC
jgi:hypothetical protein